MKKLTLIFSLAAACLPMDASAFSRQGHETVALLAFNSSDLSPKARAAIQKILGDETIDRAATWPDDIKPRQALHNTAEAQAFNKAHTLNARWHFVNFPNGSTLYAPETKYGKPTDLPKIVEGCINVLEGGSFEGMSKHDALRFLVHLIGDVHQPLHTTFEVWDHDDPMNPKMINPPPPKAADDDLFDGGGNALYYTPSKELHALWDDELVQAVASSKETAKLVAALQSLVSVKFDAATGKDYRKWVEGWVTQSMLLVPDAYKGITANFYVEEVHTDKQTGKKTVTKKIMITLPPKYNENHVPVVRTQLVRGGAHLLQLFNAIKWAP